MTDEKGREDDAVMMGRNEAIAAFGRDADISASQQCCDWVVGSPNDVVARWRMQCVHRQTEEVEG